MSKSLSKSKKIKSSFSAKQPGYINVAGETFFLSDDETVFSASLYDDSIKGERAFHELFLKPFSEDEQQILRRIYQVIFGSSSIIGRKGISLPCEDNEVDLLVKSLIYRRDKLLQQIKSYDILLSDDMHARTMREHLLALNKLIDNDIPNTLAPCKDTDVDLDGTGRLSGLNNQRMLKLLEIFAFLLAQGKDPIAELISADPSPVDILPQMAKSGAKKLRDYEDEFAKKNPGKLPQYTETLKKIRRVLTDKSPEPASNPELIQALTDIEKDLGITDTSGSVADRKARILAETKKLKAALIEEGNCKRSLASLLEEKKKLEALVADLEKRIKEPNAEIERLKKQIADLELKAKKLEDEKTSLVEDANAAELMIIEKDKKIKELEAEIQAQKAQLAELEELRKRAKITQEAYDAEKQGFLNTIAEKDAIIAELRKEVEQKNESIQQKEARIKELEDAGALITKTELDKLREELEDLRKRATITPEALDALQEEVEALRKRADITPGVLKGLEDELANLRGRADITSEDLEDLQDELNGLRGRADIDEDELEELQTQLETLQNRADITPQALSTLQKTLAALELRADITPSALRALNLQIEGLKGKVAQLEKRPDITASELQTLRDQLALANEQIKELQKIIDGRPDLSGDLATVQAELAAARTRISELEKRAPITPDALQALQANLATAQQELRQLEEEVVELRKRPSLDVFEQYRAAKERLDTLDAILNGITPEKLRELLEKEAACKETSAKLKAYEETGLTPQQVLNLKAELNTNKTLISDLNDALEKLGDENKRLKEDNQTKESELSAAAATISKLSMYKTIFDELNKLLVAKGFDPLPDPTDSNLGEITGRLNTYFEKPTPQILSEITTLCMLNMVFTILRSVYTKRGTTGITDPGRYKLLFKKIQDVSKKNISTDVVDFFFYTMKVFDTVKQKLAIGSSTPIVAIDKVEEYKGKYNQVKTFASEFDSRDRDAASYILRELFPIDHDFSRYVVDENNRLRLRDSKENASKTMDISLAFLLFLSYVNKVLKEKETELEAAGCPIRPIPN